MESPGGGGELGVKGESGVRGEKKAGDNSGLGVDEEVGATLEDEVAREARGSPFRAGLRDGRGDQARAKGIDGLATE